MTAQPNLKSNSITQLDATPAVRVSAGAGAVGRVFEAHDTAPALTDAFTSGGVLRLVRLPSNCIVLSVKLWLDAAVTTATGNVGLYYSDSAPDYPSGSTGALSASLFASALAMAAIVEPTEQSGQSGTFTGAKRKQPLWQAAGLTSDPGGFFDLTFVTTATNSGAGVLNASVMFVDGGQP